MLNCVEIIRRTPIGVARGAFHLGLMVKMKKIMKIVDNDEADDDEYQGGHGHIDTDGCGCEGFRCEEPIIIMKVKFTM